MAHVARWLICFACIAVTLVTSRAASAAAFCDELAMSLHPPPPVILARDVRLELLSVTPPCDDYGQALDEEATAASSRTPSPNAESSFFLAERALAPAPSSLPRFGGERVAFAETESLPLSQDHAQGVFHPPRG